MAEVRSEAGEVLDLLTMIGNHSELSTVSKEEELQFLYLQLSFPPKREKGPRFNVDNCSEADFEQLFCLRKLVFKQLLVALQIPRKYHCMQKTVVQVRKRCSYF